MVIRSSTALCSDYNSISALAHETGEPVYITKNGDGDLVVMSIEAFEGYRRDLEQRAAVLEAEARRLAGEATYSVGEARSMLKERYVSSWVRSKGCHLIRESELPCSTKKVKGNAEKQRRPE